MSQVSLTPSDPAQKGCVQNPAGYVCNFALKIDYSNAMAGSRVGGTVTGTASQPGGPSETKSASFSLPADPGSHSVSDTVSLFFTLNACSETSAASGATDQPNVMHSRTVAFGRVCTPPPTPTPTATPTPTPTPTPPPFLASQVSLTPSGPPSAPGCQQFTSGFTCNFTLQVNYGNAVAGSKVGGSVTGTASQPGGVSETNTTTFSIPVDSGASSVSETVTLFFKTNPCVNASTAYAKTDQPNIVTGKVVAFGNSCAPPFTVSKVTLTAGDPSQTGCQQTPAGYVCNFTVAVEYSNAQSDSRVSGSVTGTVSRPQVPPQVSTTTFAIPVDPAANNASAKISVVFPTEPCVEDSSASASTDQPNAVTSASVRFGRTCTPG